MNRLLPELNRLYGLGPDTVIEPAQGGHATRALVMATMQPADWQRLSSVWRGVQSDLGLPAPAIAVSGTDALQLWFSLASPILPTTGARFLQGLRERYLNEVGSQQIRMFVGPADLPAPPSSEVEPQHWSAFVTHDLAALFAETPWLDVPPGDEGQATLLRTLEPMGRAAFGLALDRLGIIETALPIEPVADAPTQPARTADAGQRDSDPFRFLASVMNDVAAPLALRIEAARILLPYAQAAQA